MKNINRQTHIFIFELVIAIAFFALEGDSTITNLSDTISLPFKIINN